MKTKQIKRQIRAARKAKMLRLARWNNVPHMRSKFAHSDLRDRGAWSYADRAAAVQAATAAAVGVQS